MYGERTASDDPTRYRSASELDEWEARDPIARLERLLHTRGWLDDEFSAEVDAACTALADETRTVCRQMPLGDITTMFGTVLSQETALLAEERSRYEALIVSFVD
ncbi:MAG: hypothetical protein ABS81_10310 [Pseudonocardia sp. SCN 72-86]|nr:MAG: hypothetical protein ABS81_10310 [Pseudonocardia sp. SCN 72-86]